MSLSEEENCIRVVGEALRELAANVGGPAGSSAVSATEGIEYVEIVHQLVGADNDPIHLRGLLFTASPTLLSSLFTLLAWPQYDSGPAEVTQLTAAILRVVARMNVIALDAENQETQIGRQMSTAYSESVQKGKLVSTLTSLIGPASSPQIRTPAAETLFSLLMRSSTARQTVAESGGVPALLSTLDDQTSSDHKPFVSACLREIANTHAWSLTNQSAIDTLVRVLGLGDTSDVRALSAETLDVMFKCEPQAWVQCQRKKELSGNMTTRIEQETASEALEAILKLLETLIVSDAALPESMDSTFTDHFLALYGDRVLISALKKGIRVASLGARCLRLLVQMAPFYRHVGMGVFHHFPSLSVVLKAILELADNTTLDTVPHQVARVEVAIAFALMLAQDPRCRIHLAEQFASHPHRVSSLRSALLHHLNTAALDYYSGIAVVDITGYTLNAPTNVEWEPGLRPTKTSIKRVFDDQARRWEVLANRGETGAADSPSFLQGDGSTEYDAQVTRLTFIELSYATHMALADGPVEGHQSAHSSPARHAQSFSTPNYQPQQQQQQPPQHHTASFIDPYAEVDASKSHDPSGPMPTRTSLLREMRAHPTRAETVKRAKSMQEVFDGVPRPAAYYNTQPAPPSAESPARTRLNASGRGVGDVRPLTKFDLALKLCTTFAQCYNRVGEPRKVIYETTNDGVYARRQGTTVPDNWHKSNKTKSWGVENLKQGDLFFFSVPYTSLSMQTLETVRRRALTHCEQIRKQFLITPQVAKSRRWFLYDMVNHVMPAIVDVLAELLQLFATHGEENAKFPIVMFRETELMEQGHGATLHSGNVVDVVDQVKYYFQNSTRAGGAFRGDVNATGLSGGGASPAAGRGTMTSQYLNDLDNKISSLTKMKFDPRENFPSSFGAMGGGSDGSLSDGEEDVVSIADPRGGFDTASEMSSVA